VTTVPLVSAANAFARFLFHFLAGAAQVVCVRLICPLVLRRMCATPLLVRRTEGASEPTEAPYFFGRVIALIALRAMPRMAHDSPAREGSKTMSRIPRPRCLVAAGTSRLRHKDRADGCGAPLEGTAQRDRPSQLGLQNT